MIIYSKSFPGWQYRFEGPDDALYAKSDLGWIDSELFLKWMNKIFLKHVAIQRPVLLFIDGHKSHINFRFNLTYVGEMKSSSFVFRHTLPTPYNPLMSLSSSR